MKNKISNPKTIRKHQKKIHKESLSIHYDNLTAEQRKSARTQLFIRQDGCCAICSQPEKDSKRLLHLDHCHTTGHIRGLLCNRCNFLLGIARDNVHILQAAIEYLIEANDRKYY